MQVFYKKLTEKQPPAPGIITHLLESDNPFGAIMAFAKAGHLCDWVGNTFRVRQPRLLAIQRLMIKLLYFIGAALIIVPAIIPLFLPMKDIKLMAVFFCLYLFISLCALLILNNADNEEKEVKAVKILTEK
jgi:hypothetical protein